MQGFAIELVFCGNNLLRLAQGLWVTVRIGLLSIGLSVLPGVLLGLLLRAKSKALRALARGYVEAVRLLPQMVLLFLAYFGLTRAFGWELSAEVSAVLVFTLWGAAELGDLVRGALESIPRHQYDSAWALGMDAGVCYRCVILPQTLRRLLPPAINLATRMIKTTSLVVLIGVVEVLKVAQQIVDANHFSYPTAALTLYGVVFALYFLLCWPISCLAGRLEQRWRDHA